MGSGAEGLVGMHTLRVSGTSGQGYAGGTGHWTSAGDHRISGGGGGASEVGESGDHPGAVYGNGGDGVQNYINGTGHYWAGGGGGGTWNSSRGGNGGNGGGGGGATLPEQTVLRAPEEPG